MVPLQLLPLFTTEPLLWMCQAEYRQHIEKDAAFERRFQQVRTQTAWDVLHALFLYLPSLLTGALPHTVLHCMLGRP